jgi:hypothetical protein
MVVGLRGEPSHIEAVDAMEPPSQVSLTIYLLFGCLMAKAKQRLGDVPHDVHRVCL